MKISNIRVSKLFGEFDHEIALNINEHITIIHGQNGLGKTTLLNMIHNFFSHQFYKLSVIPFKEFVILFDDNSSVLIENNESIYSEKNSISIIYKPSEGKNQHYKPSFDDEDSNFSLPIHMLDDLIPGLDQIGPRHWRYTPTGDILTLNQILSRFSEYIPSQFIRQNNVPEWLVEIKKTNPIQFIKTERLTLKNLERENFRRLPHEQNTEHSVTVYANELAREIKSKLADYGALSQSLDRTFPARLVRLRNPEVLDNIELLNKLNELETKREKLIKLGLLDSGTDPEFQVSNEEIDDRTRSVLSIYVRDTEKKLNVFNDLASRIDLLKKIVKARFRHKEMVIDKVKGIEFVTSRGETLHPMSLSSGEQHQIVLLYELLFKITSNSLILIDEPELSLHVAWQVQFLRDLKEITEVVPFDVLIATHSPQIINDRWDLTVALEEDEFDESEYDVEVDDDTDIFLEGLFK
ncbi:ATP-binding protein [Paenibacillus sp. J45TS6]|uniref:AAA family ATPase n=1 Tax=Paenibacillus sp. J45TS6 TaxID=2807196 RepID=UPI001B0227A9|nr:AAA family ATPase [Paenibacillus sp. J45TS6]GIP43195.1 ATP-binding protein [Paenibacillus sp. J45TS6]